jgi:hypothetical protein
MRARLACLLLLAGAAHADDPIDLYIEIDLINPGDKPKRHSHYICELDGASFMVPRRIVENATEDDPFILKASNGITLGLPWQRALCRELEVWK